ncbi:hypothetical protein ACHAWF_015012 [Thalassiosira exigua]
MNDATSYATCGATAGAGRELRRCCGETRYCGVACQKKHRKVHKAECQNTNFCERKKNASALVAAGTSMQLAADDGCESFGGEEPGIDLDTFRLPPQDECPLCMFPLPVDHRASEYMICCGKRLCLACSMDHAKNSIERGVDNDIWSRCVRSGKKTIEKLLCNVEERGGGNAAFLLASGYENGLYGLPVNYQKAVGFYHRATKLGSADAAHTLGSSYMSGDIVRMDKQKARRLLTRAAKGGNLGSLHQLGRMEYRDLNNEEPSLKYLGYFRAAAEGGWKDSMDQIKIFLELGLVDEDEYRSMVKSYVDALRKETSSSRLRFNERRKKDKARGDFGSPGCNTQYTK